MSTTTSSARFVQKFTWRVFIRISYTFFTFVSSNFIHHHFIYFFFSIRTVYSCTLFLCLNVRLSFICSSFLFCRIIRNEIIFYVLFFFLENDGFLNTTLSFFWAYFFQNKQQQKATKIILSLRGKFCATDLNVYHKFGPIKKFNTFAHSHIRPKMLLKFH